MRSTENKIILIKLFLSRIDEKQQQEKKKKRRKEKQNKKNRISF